MDTLAALRERRAFECRLTPDRALGSLDEAEAFLRDRGLLTRTPDCALPSLYEACHEEPYQPAGHGFAAWPATKWPWFGELGERGYLIVAVHRGKNLLISGEVARLLDPICRAEIARMRAEDRGWALLLDHLAAAGPAVVDDLRVELRMKRQDLRALRSPLQRCGAIVARSVQVTAGEGHQHTSELSRWDQVYPGSSDPPSGPDGGGTRTGPDGGAAQPGPDADGADAGPDGGAAQPGPDGGAAQPGPDGGGADISPGAAFRELLVAAVRAAVLAPERELRRWFSWSWYWADTLVDDLVREQRLIRLNGHIATPHE